MKLRIENMTCGGCARSVTATIKNIDPNATVDIDVATKLVNVQSSVDEQKIKEALAEDGFPALNA
ncbi:heavy-metal-associated domain-containing protein [Acinetobacter celticus]|uniref:Heavy metal transporter n=1 Tax=Acinetobacter celticus TaxID=1891224 RepID=A0A1C3CT98_9GAMM|nr:heavy-metal-associated domain-containing protein [Acinetobacter celticus]MBP8099397.1 heavy-metal-associated domain-containing protein [Acinetobacter sp.]ODA11958.1 heavy metal transporter [Acinetobacter celticus]